MGDYEEFAACCDGIETEHIIRDRTRCQNLVNVDLWEQSRARAEWARAHAAM